VTTATLLEVTSAISQSDRGSDSCREEMCQFGGTSMSDFGDTSKSYFGDIAFGSRKWLPSGRNVPLRRHFSE